MRINGLFFKTTSIDKKIHRIKNIYYYIYNKNLENQLKGGGEGMRWPYRAFNTKDQIV